MLEILQSLKVQSSFLLFCARMHINIFRNLKGFNALFNLLFLEFLLTVGSDGFHQRRVG
jgi:hypothetical protein